MYLYLNKKNVQLNEADIIDKELTYLLKYVIKTNDTPDLFINQLLKKLSTNIFVKESKWTWIL